MPRLSVLLAALALLAGCDATPAPVPFNPYDPGFDGVGLPTGPSMLTLEAATATSVTIRWDDRSSFESGYAVRGVPYPDAPFGAARPSIILPPNTTSFTAEGLIGAGPTEMSVRAVTSNGGQVGSTASLTVRYGGLTSFEVETGVGGLIVPEAGLLYRAAGGIEVYEAAFDGAEPGRRIGGVTGYDRLVGRVTGGDVVAETVEAGGTARPVAVLRGLAVVTAVELASPDGAFVGEAVVAADGSRVAVRYETGGATRIGTWNLTTGAFLGDVADPSRTTLARLLMVTVGGTVVLEDGLGDVVAVRLANGAEIWREAVARIAFRVAVDPPTGRVAMARTTLSTRVVSADDGATEATLGLRSVGGPMFLAGSTLVTNDGPNEVVRTLPSGAIIRAFQGPTRITSGAVEDGALVLFDGSETIGRAFRLALDAEWEVAE